MILMRKRIVSKSTQKPGCFANDFDAQAHCIKINAKIGVCLVGLIQLPNSKRSNHFLHKNT